MMDCLWVKQGSGLFPADPVTAELIATVGQGQHVRTNEPHKPRNPDFHKLMMAGLSQIVANTYPRFADVEEAMDWLKLKSGMVDFIDIGDGRERIKFKSVSFSSMDQVKFKAVSEQWRDIALEEFGVDLLAERV
jgi:hypothetical protein